MIRVARAVLAAGVLAASPLLAAFAGQADPVAEGYLAYKAGDYAKARAAFESAAGQGNPRAMNYLGEMFAAGKGVLKDPGKALEWFRAGARKGDPDSQNNLGEMHANGWGTPQDFKEAARWFRKAADSGNAQGDYNLGRLLAMGAGVDKNLAEAAERFNAAVKAKPGDAKYRDWLGSVLCDLGKHQEAEDQFRAIVTNGGKPEDAWNYYWGVSLMKLEKLDDAAEAFRRVAGEPSDHNRGVDRRTEAAQQAERISHYQASYRKAMSALAVNRGHEAREGLAEALGFVETREARERLAAIEGMAKEGRFKGLIIVVLAGCLIVAVASGIRLSRRQAAPATRAQAPLPADLVGTRFAGRYELRSIIGEGGMGQVYEAFDHAENGKVAIKRMRSELRSMPDAKERFLKEARAISKLRHPGIVGVRRVVEDGAETFIVMDFVEGEPLATLLHRRGRLSVSECKRLLGQVCAAVEFAHRNNVVHRDLKPSNVMVDTSGRAMVMDFGIAREMKDALTRMTTTEVIGTPVYMAPEQHHGKVCRQSDVFALGVNLYEMAAGQRPFGGPDPLAQKERGTCAKPSSLVPGLPAELDSLVASALDPDPAKRPKTAAEFSDLLGRVPEA
ncbi:MAG: protein kinase [Elusimicrobia bacterium]|nr:protein kinase [Elusimicrobiota bacterium]